MNYSTYNHCFMHCYDCPELYDVEGVDFDTYPWAVVISDDKFKALFPADPNDPLNPTSSLCIAYHGCCYCNHYYVLQPVNVDETSVIASASTECAGCEAAEGVGCAACPPAPLVCPGKPPLLEQYAITFDGEFTSHNNSNPSEIWHYTSPKLVTWSSACRWSWNDGSGAGCHHQTCTLNLEPFGPVKKWYIVMFQGAPSMGYWMMEWVKETGLTPEGAYSFLSDTPYTNCPFYDSNTISNVVVSALLAAPLILPGPIPVVPSSSITLPPQPDLDKLREAVKHIQDAPVSSVSAGILRGQLEKAIRDGMLRREGQAKA